MTEFEPTYALARTAFEAGNYEAAVRHCEDILKKSPAETEAWFLRGLALISEAGSLGDRRVSSQGQFMLLKKGAPAIAWELLQTAKRLTPPDGLPLADLP